MTKIHLQMVISVSMRAPLHSGRRVMHRSEEEQQSLLMLEQICVF